MPGARTLQPNARLADVGRLARKVETKIIKQVVFLRLGIGVISFCNQHDGCVPGRDVNWNPIPSRKQYTSSRILLDVERFP